MGVKIRPITVEEANKFRLMSPIEVRFKGTIMAFRNDSEKGPEVQICEKTPPAKSHDEKPPMRVWVPLQHVFKQDIDST